MSVNIDYQALPAECSLLKRAVAELEFGAELWLLSATLQRMYRFPNLTPVECEFQQEVDALCAANPGIENRNRDFMDKSWDIMHFLISENRRREKEGVPGPSAFLSHNWEMLNLPKYRYKSRWVFPYVSKDWGTSVIRGAVQLAPHLTSGQGHPIRFNPPDTVQECAEYLALLELSDIEPHYEQQKRRDLHFYGGEYDLEYLWRNFMELRDLYTDAAANREGILVKMY